jgi:FkbM family methyltransferase
MTIAQSIARGLHRFAPLRAVGKRLMRRRTVRQPFHGGVICLDAVEHSWAWTGAVRLESWDRPLQDRLLTLSRDCATMIDVGGNVGTMTLSVALRNRAIRIITIEPNARAVQLLRRSVRLNGLADRVDVVEAIAADADGRRGFAEAGSATGHVTVEDRASATKEAVDFRRLLTGQAGRARTLIKIDVEGFETTLLRCLPDGDALRRLVLVVELHALGFNGFGDPVRCVTMLRENGAAVRGIDGRSVDDLSNWTDSISTVQIEAWWP